MKKLSAAKREITGKKVHKLRKEEMIPASIYGPSHESTNISIELKGFPKFLENVGFSKLFKLEIEGDDKSYQVLIKDIQIHPLSGHISHIAFYAVDPKKELSTDVPIRFEGDPIAVKNKVGFLTTAIESLEIRCLPANLPSELILDISSLANIGDSFTVGDITLPEGVELQPSMTPDEVIITVEAPQKQLIEDETPAAEGEEAAETTETTEAE